MLALRIFNFLATGWGGWDHAGLDTALALFDPPDNSLELLLWQLDLIKRYRPPKPGETMET